MDSSEQGARSISEAARDQILKMPGVAKRKIDMNTHNAIDRGMKGADIEKLGWDEDLRSMHTNPALNRWNFQRRFAPTQRIPNTTCSYTNGNNFDRGYLDQYGLLGFSIFAEAVGILHLC